MTKEILLSNCIYIVHVIIWHAFHIHDYSLSKIKSNSTSIFSFLHLENVFDPQPFTRDGITFGYIFGSWTLRICLFQF